MAKSQSLQDPFLNALRKEKVPVSIYLVNGIKLQGQIDSFDQFVVLLRNSVSQMVYKHAISTVVPARNVRVPGHGRGRGRGLDAVPWPQGGKLLDRPRSGERALLLHIGLPRPCLDDEIQEFRALAESAGARVVGEVQARRDRPDPKYFVGSGKVDEVAARVRETQAELDSRQPAPAAGQERNLEMTLKTRVLDRNGLILDIFAQRAAHLRRQAPSRARAARAPRIETRARVDAPRAAEGRHRLAGSRRDAARNGPAAREPAHPLFARSPRRASSASARWAARSAAGRRPDGRAGRLHERRQDDAVQRVGGRQPRRQGSTVRDPRSDGPALERSGAAARCCSWIPSASSAICRTSSSRRSAPR